MQKPVGRSYLSAVDGLRTVAVLFVLVFHADATWLPGGFIGVDLFFVISGFLITRNIVADVEADRWSLGDFYRRRIARLFPALYATIAGTLIAAPLVLPPPDLERFGQIALSTIASISNVIFWLEAGYFDVSAGEKPLLHTWSLAVEEQFYLVWPFVVVLLLTRGGRRLLPFGLLAMAILSLALALLMEPRAPDAVFFLTPFRAYQFALGGMVALLPLAPNEAWRTLIGVLALVAIGLLGLLVDHGSGHFWNATMPAFMAAAVILAAPGRAMTALLGNGPMVWIGKRSYSIYLVHWPLMVLWRFGAADQPPGEPVLLAGLAIVLGCLLHALVERRFRFTAGLEKGRRRRVLAGVAAAAFAIILTGGQFWRAEGYPGRLPAEITELVALDGEWQARQEVLRTGRCNLVGAFEPDHYDDAVCATVATDRPSYFVLGDSFASDAYLVLSAAFPDVHFLQMTIPGCTLRLPEDFNGRQAKACQELYRHAFDEIIKRPGLDGVVLAANWLDGDGDRIDAILGRIEQTGIDVVLVGQHLRLKNRLPSIVLSSFSVEEAKARAEAQLLAGPARLNEALRRRFAHKATFLDFLALQCPAACDVIRDDVGLMYLDDSHLSLGGVEILARRLADQRTSVLARALTH